MLSTESLPQDLNALVAAKAEGKPSGKLIHEPRLADTRFPHHRDQLPAPAKRTLERLAKLLHLLGTPDVGRPHHRRA